MISNAEIREAVQKAQPVFEKIHGLYQLLPETTCACEEPGTCCAFLPEMTLMEALHWFRVMQQTPAADRMALTHKFVEFYLTNPIRHIGCPFLSKGHCGIYEYRTFACRAYGLWSKSMGQERTQQSREGKMILVKMWQRYGIEIDTEAITDEMDYCGRVGCESDLIISDKRLMAILQEIYLLDNELTGLHNKFENEYYSDFSFLFTSLALGTKKSILGKFAVIKELSREGTDKRLKNLLSQIKLDGIIPMD
jgi:Fe-S-cluster containining protein